MLKTLRSNTSKGFTLVEIMIVVAIIALLASIAVPNFMRARSRSQATSILEEMRLVDAAKDQWAIENNKGNGAAAPAWADLKPYLKTGSRLQQADAPTDLLGNAITLGAVGVPATISETTVTAFTSLYPEAPEGATDFDGEKVFWGAYHPDNATATDDTTTTTGG